MFKKAVLYLHLSRCNVSKTVTKPLASISAFPRAAWNTSGMLSSFGDGCRAPQQTGCTDYRSPSLSRGRTGAAISPVSDYLEAVGQELLCGLSSTMFVRKTVQKRCWFYATDKKKKNQLLSPTFSSAEKSNLALAVKAVALVLWR